MKYFFPVELGAYTRGIATSYAAPILEKQFILGDDPIPVWPYGEGDKRGLALEPLYSSVPKSLAQFPDQTFYELLALVDAIRSGRVRERTIAIALLKEKIHGKSQARTSYSEFEKITPENAQLINLYRQAEDYFFRGISLKCVDLDDGAIAYMTGGAGLNFIYITRNTNILDKILVQGKGYATHLMRYVLSEAKKLGAHHCFLESSDSGLGVYQKLGFEPLFKNNIYSRKA